MNILHLSTSDCRGAYEAAIRLHRAFLENKYKSRVAVRYKTIHDKTILECQSSISPIVLGTYDFFLKNFLHKNKEYYFFNTYESLTLCDAQRVLDNVHFKPDIIIVHWISRFINTKTIYKLQRKTNATVIWHMLDMAPMTGGCHYAWNCKGYQKRCGMCPAIYSHSKVDLSSINLSVKKRFLTKIQPIIITPTSELYNQCKKSTLFRKTTIYKILLPIDTNIFSPGHKKELRMEVGIPSTSKVICIRSDIPQQKRKGFDYIINCLSILKALPIRNIHIAIIGRISKNDMGKIPFPNTIFPSLNSNEDLADVYRLSDVLLSASIQDSGPMMVNEAISSGLPVVSFPIGVSKDLIFNGKTGFIARLKSSSDLAHRLRVLLSFNKTDYQKMSHHCRKLALEKFSYSKVVMQYEQIL
jgi:glycosyltransferase involved in cell wall biosynthesis